MNELLTVGKGPLVSLPEAQLKELWNLLDKEKSLTAYEKVRGFGAFENWEAGENRQLAVRLSSRLGAGRLAEVLAWRNAKAFPENVRFQYQAQFGRLGRGRFLEVYDTVNQLLQQGGLDPENESDLLCMKGWLFARWHDFAPAYEAVAKARSLNPTKSWPFVQEAEIYELADRREEALQSIGEALRIQPNYRPAVSRRYRLLLSSRRQEEGEAFLREVLAQSDVADAAALLVGLFDEQERWSDARWALQEYERLSPLIDRPGKEWVAARRADIELREGNYPAFFTQVELTAKKSFQRKVAKNIQEGEGGGERVRKVLPVAFVQQHRLTCAPATIASLAEYWKIPCSHEEIVEEICYDGTPWHRERGWAEKRDLLVKEFKVTPEITKQLIDRGVPFSLGTSWTTGAHLQALVGYDELPKAFVIRDPTFPHSVEMLWGHLGENHPYEGPRGFLFLPKAKANLLEGVTFEDDFLYQKYYEFCLARDEADRVRMGQAFGELVSAGGKDYPFVLFVQMQLASYDGNKEQELACVEQLLSEFPKVNKLHLARLSLLQRLGRREEKYTVLKPLAGGKGKEAVFFAELADWYSEDARQVNLARFFYRKALQWEPTNGRYYSSCADLLEEQGEKGDSLFQRRIATMLEPSFEGYAWSYFLALVRKGEREEGLTFLASRTDDTGSFGGARWLTWVRAEVHLGQLAKARDVLQQALTKYPEEGSLLLEAGHLLSQWGEIDRAKKCLQQAKTHVSEQDWFHNAASIYSFLGEREEAKACWQYLYELNPQAANSVARLAEMLDEEESGAGLKLLREVTQKHPHNPSLLSLFIERCGYQKEENEEALEALERALRMYSIWPWAQREQALRLEEAGRIEEAEEVFRLTCEQAPHDEVSQSLYGNFLKKQGKYLEAEERLRQALKENVDYHAAMEGVILLAKKQGAVAEGLSFVRTELEKQVSAGDAVFNYRELVYPLIEPDELQRDLEGFCEVRPDLWQTWSALSLQSLDMEDFVGAQRAVDELSKRFPLLPRTYYERAQVAQRAGRIEDEARELEKAMSLSPAWGVVVRQLADAYERLERSDEALELLERQRVALPSEPGNHGMAGRLWEMKGEREKAFQAFVQSVKANVSYSWGWRQLAYFGKEWQREGEVVELLQEMHQAYSYNSKWWMTYYENLYELGEIQKADEVLKNARERFPFDPEIMDFHVNRLVEMGKLDEAGEACEFKGWKGTLPVALQGRKSWVTMQRGFAEEAVSEMESLLEKEVDYVWGHQTLLRWYRGVGDWEKVYATSKKLVRLEPKSALAWGYSAEAAGALEKKDDQRFALEKAWRLDPEYSYAGRELIELYAVDQQFDRAREILAEVEHYGASPFTAVDAIDLELSAGKEEEAFKFADNFLVKYYNTDGEAFEYLYHVVQKASPAWRKRWRARLKIAVQEDRSGQVLSLWVRENLPKRASWGIAWRKCHYRVQRSKLSLQEKESAWVRLIASTGKDQPDANFRSHLLHRHRKIFRKSPRLWGEVLEVLFDADEPRRLDRWIRGWEDRIDSMSDLDFLNVGYRFIAKSGFAACRIPFEEGIKRFPTSNRAEFMIASLALLAQIEQHKSDIEYYEALIAGRSIIDFTKGIVELQNAVRFAQEGDKENSSKSYRLSRELQGEYTLSKSYRRSVRRVLSKYRIKVAL